MLAAAELRCSHKMPGQWGRSVCVPCWETRILELPPSGASLGDPVSPVGAPGVWGTVPIQSTGGLSRCFS